MTDISKYFNKKQIVFLEATTRDQALAELVDCLVAAKKVKDRQAFLDAIIAREELVSTGIGMGVAIPHAKLPIFNDFFVAVGVQKGDGIPWQALDGAPVKLIFMIGGPDDKQTEYLQILSRLTVAIKNHDRRKAALEASTPKDFIELFKNL